MSDSDNALRLSFEFFPPKTEVGREKLAAVHAELNELEPHFFSVTYGAGGTTRERTHHTVHRILEETKLKPAAHQNGKRGST